MAADTDHPQSPYEVADSEILVTQTLVDRTYALRATPNLPLWKRILKTGISIALFPLTAAVELLWAVAVATPLQETLVSMVIPRIMDRVDKEFKEERRTLLSGISGRVLDVGCGGGAYLKYLTDPGVAWGPVDVVVAVEPNEKMHPIIRSAGMDLSGRLKIVRDIDDLSEQDYDGTFDWVILGNVLCEVDDVKRTVDRVNRLLTPGGRLYFQEHVAQERGTWQRWVQDVVNPLWRHLGTGCNCNRESHHVIRQHAGWEGVVEWRYDHIQVMLGPQVLGLAQKKKNFPSMLR